MLHYPGRVTYSATGFLEKNKDPLSQDIKVLMQYSEDEFVSSLFTDKKADSGRAQFKSAKFVGVIDSFRTSLNELVKTLSATKTHFIRCVKPNEKKAPHTFVSAAATHWRPLGELDCRLRRPPTFSQVDSVTVRQLYTSGVLQVRRDRWLSISARLRSHLGEVEIASRRG